MDRDLELQALQDTRRRIAALEALLEDLPELFESRFRQRLQPLLDQQRLLLQNNADLRQHLLLRNGGLGRRRPLRLLPRPPLNAFSAEPADAGALPTAVSADPTHR
ncbi:MAG: hypothetical protein RLZZ336_1952 [Cyanobacteriota bacterium]